MAKVASSFKALVLESLPHFWSDYKDGEYTLQVQLGSGIETSTLLVRLKRCWIFFYMHLIKVVTSIIILISLFWIFKLSLKVTCKIKFTYKWTKISEFRFKEIDNYYNTRLSDLCPFLLYLLSNIICSSKERKHRMELLCTLHCGS